MKAKDTIAFLGDSPATLDSPSTTRRRAHGSQWNKPKNLYDTPTFHISSSTAKPGSSAPKTNCTLPSVRRLLRPNSGREMWNGSCVYGTTPCIVALAKDFFTNCLPFTRTTSTQIFLPNRSARRVDCISLESSYAGDGNGCIA